MSAQIKTMNYKKILKNCFKSKQHETIAQEHEFDIRAATCKMEDIGQIKRYQ